ncbi:MAG: ribonuclease HII [Christensenellaceae bacterium]|jgi:ribonuclease HII|nr:ribonuclease HII [Christensenellaceae bacterium]
MSNEIIIGVDEVGAGSLAGPLLVCAVAIDKESPQIYGITDSKKLSSNQREAFSQQLDSTIMYKSFAFIPHQVIDDINILESRKKGMQFVINDILNQLLSFNYQIDNIKIKVDGTNLNLHIDYDFKIEYIIKGDSKEYAISCASILAKVLRDAKMKEFATIYPEYGFDKNMGYGSAQHIKDIQEIGLCEIHRKSFCKGILQRKMQCDFWNL